MGIVCVLSLQVNGKGKVTDLCSFYHLPSSVMKNEKHSKLNAAYSFYNVATTVPLPQLMDDLLVQAKVWWGVGCRWRRWWMERLGRLEGG
jgi:glycylpeptide N-tetradecanoyltransferase